MENHMLREHAMEIQIGDVLEVSEDVPEIIGWRPENTERTFTIVDRGDIIIVVNIIYYSDRTNIIKFMKTNGDSRYCSEARFLRECAKFKKI